MIFAKINEERKKLLRQHHRQSLRFCTRVKSVLVSVTWCRFKTVSLQTRKKKDSKSKRGNRFVLYLSTQSCKATNQIWSWAIEHISRFALVKIACRAFHINEISLYRTVVPCICPPPINSSKQLSANCFFGANIAVNVKNVYFEFVSTSFRVLVPIKYKVCVFIVTLSSTL